LHPKFAQEIPMRKFAFGAVIGLAVVAALMYAYLRFGFLDFRADTRPSGLETRQAMAFLDASVDRRAPDGATPQLTEEQVVEGVKLYKTYCAECHGSPERAEQKLASLSFYPPAPQFMDDAPDMSENDNFYIIQHGIRCTGMPAWGKNLSTQQLWEVADFLGQMNKLPPAAAQEWHAAPAHDALPGMETTRHK
jgi:mono/diheme cytochrome c family protein